jgi:3-deoxy-D-manno-octulosonic-acid transferase
MLAPDRAGAPVAGVPAPLLADPNPGALRALLHLFYDAVWTVALALAAPVCGVRCLFDARFRRMVAERLTLGLPQLAPGKPRVLVHGVSVGEVKGAAPLVRALEAAHPELEVVISTSTDTGLEVARQTFAGRRVVRFPLDPSWLVARFLDRLAPSAVVLVELEVWPSFLRLCNRRGIPLAVVNGRITDSSFGRYHLFRRALPQFNRISLFCVQLEEYAQRFQKLGAARERVVVTGNMKADGFVAATHERDRQRLQALARLLGLRPGALVVVGGSTHAPEERLVAQAWRAALPDARLVLVPRHPPRADEVERDLAALGLAAQRLTRARGGESVDPARPLIVDTIGELESVYALSDLVFVGGSLTEHGGQNVLEPAALGRPVLHGPHVQNFRQEAALLRSAGAAREVADGAELAQALRELAADGELRRRMGEAGRTAVAAQAGATARTLKLLEELCLGRILAPAAHAQPPEPVGQSPGSE